MQPSKTPEWLNLSFAAHIIRNNPSDLVDDWKGNLTLSGVELLLISGSVGHAHVIDATTLNIRSSGHILRSLNSAYNS
jgi:hypothetical protein